MLNFNANGLPELTIRTLIDLKRQLIPLINQNGHLFEHNEPVGTDVLIDLKTKRSFYFVLFQPQKQMNGTSYTIKLNVKPTQIHNLSGFSAHLPPTKIIDEFNKWINLINSYEDALNQLQDPYDEEVIKEINELFSFLPEEGDNVETFDIPTLLMLEQILDKTSAQINEKADTNNPEVQSILKNIEEIKMEAPSQPRAIIKKKLSKLFGKIKKNAWPAFKWLIQETVKEAIKETIKGNLHLLQGMNPF